MKILTSEQIWDRKWSHQPPELKDQQSVLPAAPEQAEMQKKMHQLAAVIESDLTLHQVLVEVVVEVYP